MKGVERLQKFGPGVYLWTNLETGEEEWVRNSRVKEQHLWDGGLEWESVRMFGKKVKSAFKEGVEKGRSRR